MKGLITKLTGGLYTVLAEDKEYNCKARGKFRHINESPKVGDYVNFNEESLYILEILERKNSLIRPSVANIDQAILVFSAKEPDMNYNLLDRLLSLIELNNIKPLIVVSKIDLLSVEEEHKLKENMNYYEKYYEVYYLSSKEKIGLEAVKNLFQDKVTVLSGQSGVGKSSFINAIGDTNLATSEISKALGRGRHTTRHTELHRLFGGFIADTPGFSSLEFEQDVTPLALAESFIDFRSLSDECRFSTCIHVNEPKCKVKEELAKGNILPSRYENYLAFQEELRLRKKKY